LAMKQLFTLLLLVTTLSAFGQSRDIEFRFIINGRPTNTLVGISICEGETWTFVDSSRVRGAGSIVRRILPFSNSDPRGCKEIIEQTAQSITVRFNCPSFKVEDCWGRYPEECPYPWGESYQYVAFDDNGYTEGLTITDAVKVYPKLQVKRIGNRLGNNIDLQVSGGMGPYTFLWNDGATTEDRHNLPDGNYCVTVTDQLGCTAVDTCYRAVRSINAPTAYFVALDRVPTVDNGNTWIQITVCYGDSLTFEDQSIGYIVGRKWEFELDSTGRNKLVITGNKTRVTIKYDKLGVYKAKLTVYDTIGQEHTYITRTGRTDIVVVPRSRISEIIRECVDGKNRFRIVMPPEFGYQYSWDNGRQGNAGGWNRSNERIAPTDTGNIPPGRYCVTIQQISGFCTIDTCIDFQLVCDPFETIGTPLTKNPQPRKCTEAKLTLPHRTTSTTAQINWQAMQGVSHYQVSWRKFGSNQWQNVRLNNPNAADYLITNLQPFTTYQFRVQPWCIGAWQYAGGGIGTFTTQP